MIWYFARRPSQLIAAAVITLAALSCPVATFSQAVPTAEQLRIFQDLSPEQQQAVLEQMGGTGEARSASGVEDARDQRSAGPVRLRAVEEPRRDVLGPEDWVVVELALPGTMQRGAVRNSAVQDPNAETAPRRLRQSTSIDAGTERRLRDVISRVQLRNPYRLDSNGQLHLPGVPPILLAGLDDQQAVLRLSIEPSLLNLDVSVQRLPVDKVGAEGLKAFGYDLFKSAMAGASGVDVPAPADYVVGPGDQFSIQLFGSQNRTHRLMVNREGAVNLPELGPVPVGGLRFSEARAAIQGRVARQLVGVQASVSLGDMRSIGVFVLGEVRAPGSHTLSGLATMTSALFVAGGISEIGSLRNVQLKRQGQVVRRLDLYDLLIEGDTSDDAKLQPGDVVFVPPVGLTASIDGEVRRPAIYELSGETDVLALLAMSGGLTPEADPSLSSLVRVDEQLRRNVLNVNLQAGAGNIRLRNGDALRVARLRPQIDSGVVVEGFVHRPGVVAWRPGLRLTDVLGSIDELKPAADAGYVLVRRESGSDRRVEVISADLLAAHAQRGGAADILLQSRDRITVFDLAASRSRIIQPLLDELRLQAGLGQPTGVVRIEGRVKAPGEYPLETGMKVSDLLRAGGNLETAAFGGRAELARYEVAESGTRQAELIDIDLAAVLRGDPGANIALRPFDYLLIKETPEWAEQGSVTLRGEVRFPGTYPIRRGETLYEVLQRAGGLTPRAFAKGSAFTRDYLRENERIQKERLAERLRSDLASLSLQAAAADQAGASQALASSQSLLAQLQSSTPVGRMVIDVPGLLSAGQRSDKNVVLRDGDLLVVPQARQDVTVIGEVQNATSHLFSANLGRDDYIAQSGGVTRKADKSLIHIVRADGSVVTSARGLLRRGYSVAIQPGDTIVVPIDTERMPRLPFWQAVTQIVYNLAVSVAAVNSF